MREQYRSITAPDKQSKCAKFRATWAEKEFRTYQELPLSRVVKSESIVGGSQARVGSTGGSTMKNRRFLGSGCLVSSTTVQSMLADGLLEPRLQPCRVWPESSAGAPPVATHRVQAGLAERDLLAPRAVRQGGGRWVVRLASSQGPTIAVIWCRR
jgi:hypothetical protein